MGAATRPGLKDEECRLEVLHFLLKRENYPETGTIMPQPHHGKEVKESRSNNY